MLSKEQRGHAINDLTPLGTLLSLGHLDLSCCESVNDLTPLGAEAAHFLRPSLLPQATSR